MKELGERLRILRESVKLSQVKMAELLGVKQSSINRYEQGQSAPSLETLVKYADYFDVSMVKRPFPSNKDCSVPASSLITAVVICIPGFSFAKVFFGISDNTLSALCSGASVDASSVCDVSFSLSAVRNIVAFCSRV